MAIYLLFCQYTIYRFRWSVALSVTTMVSSQQCSVLSTTLIPDKRLILLSTDSQTSSSLHGDVQSGGTWWPTHCEARDRVAVVIPYRARKNHLGLLLDQLHSLLQRQLIHYKIYVIEQVQESTADILFLEMSYRLIFYQSNISLTLHTKRNVVKI